MGTGHPAESPERHAEAAAQGEPSGLDLAMVNALGQRVAPFETMHEALGQRLDDADFERQPPIDDAIGEWPRLIQQCAGPAREGHDDLPQRRRCLRIGERFRSQAGGTQHIDGNVHAVELPIVLGAVLKMVDHLQRIA